MHNMDLNNRSLNGGFIKKSKDQFLREASAEIATLKDALKQYEAQAKAGYEQIEKMKWQIVQLRMGVAALATHGGLTPDQVKEIYEVYCAREDAKIQEQIKKDADEAKTKFLQDLKDGKKVEFQQAPNPEAKSGEN